MQVFSAVALFVILFVVVIFLTLPWGVRTNPNPTLGHAASSPENIRLGLKIVISALISAVLTLIVLFGIEGGFVFHSFTRG